MNIVLLISVLLFSANLFAGFNEGLNAYNLGDYKTAFREFKIIADQGSAEAQYTLGIMHSNGQGTIQDKKKAISWFTKSAKQGYAPGQRSLGALYANGQGTMQDYVQAFMWWDIAASRGDAEAQKYRDIIQKKMIPADISKAQGMALECIAKEYEDC